MKKHKLALFLCPLLSVPLLAQQSGDLMNINGAEIFVRIVGQGEPLVIIHGGPGLGHNYLYDSFLRLADERKLIFYDQRGCGKSSALTREEPQIMDLLVEDLEGLRKELRLNSMVLAGQSWGSNITILYCQKYAQNVKKLLLLEPAPASDEYTPRVGQTISGRLTKEDQEALKTLSEKFDLNSDLKMFLEYREILSKTYFVNKELAARNPFSYFDDAMLAKFNSTSKSFATYRSRYDLYGRMDRIKCPVIIIHGAYDIVPTEAVERMQALIRDSELHIIENCGHFVHIEKPDIYFSLIEEFLNRQ